MEDLRHPKAVLGVIRVDTKGRGKDAHNTPHQHCHLLKVDSDLHCVLIRRERGCSGSL